MDQALACIDFSEHAAGLVAPTLEAAVPMGSESLFERERLFDCSHFRLCRLRGQFPFKVGATGQPHALVCLEGAGHVDHGGASYAIGKGDVLLLPAAVGACVFRPHCAVCLLEIAVPEPKVGA